ncbi:MAG: DUF2029 domain-containing protein [Alphaproteobacteria bacterium]|nr:DUF2029 domain-containing protein [Alphaproteobacteria bacterium]
MTGILGWFDQKRFDRLRIGVGWAALVGHMLFVFVNAMVNPRVADSTPAYRTATRLWWRGEDVYGAADLVASIFQFNNLPAHIVLFTPFWAVGQPLGGALWRVFSIAVFAAGLARLAVLLAPRRAAVAIAVAFLVIQPSASSVFTSGQVHVVMLGLMMLAMADIAVLRWWRASLWLALAVAFKPLAVVLVLLCFAVYPAIRARLAASIALVIAIPFIHPDPGFVASEYVVFAQKMVFSAQPEGGKWAFIGTLVEWSGVDFSGRFWLGVSAAAALATLGLAALARRDLDPRRAALAITMLAFGYLLLFNPRTEPNSYIALGVLMGFGAIDLSLLRGRERAAVFVWLAAAVVGPRGRMIDPWLLPGMAVVFLSWYLPAFWRWRGPREQPRLERGAAGG